jgi:periplasmic divalent cation tolerance protein
MKKKANMDNNFIFLYVTFSSKTSASELAKKCLENGLIACANIIPDITSIYKWNNKIEQNSEVIAIFKTNNKKKQKLVQFIKENHEYECPCIASFNTEILNHDFSAWINKSLNE